MRQRAVGRRLSSTPAERSAPTVGEHVLDTEAGPGSDVVAEPDEEQVPGVIDGEEQLCGTRNIHAAEYKTELRA